MPIGFPPLRALFGLAIAAFTFVSPALADKRVALVIGNSAYENVGRLGNPANDADAIAGLFKSSGFDVVESRRDLKYNETRRLLRDFGDKARDADIAVIYYAGHGIEVDGTNYIVPVDAALERDVDVYDEGVALDRILVSVEPAKKLRLVILDACRDNPFAKAMKRTLGTRAIGRGLSKVEPNSPNTLIAFAAKAGSTASDGDSKNSPFTAALVKHIATPGLDLRKAFGRVRDEVLKNTSNKQEPFVYGSLGGDDVALVPERAAPPSAAVNINDGIRRDYELAERVSSLEVWDAFISNHPTGFYTELAKAQRRKLTAESERLQATDKARRAEDDRARLAAEQATKKEQEEAAARAKAAEQARLVAEKRKQDEDARVAAAEKAKVEALAKIAEQQRLDAEKKQRDQEARTAAAEKAKADALAKKAEEERLAAEKTKQAEEKKVAALTPPSTPDTAPKAESINRQLQTELRRVGCYTTTVNDDWSTSAQRSLDQFNKRAGLKLDVKTASIDSVEAVRGKTSRVCPLVCGNGYRADGEKCVEIVCKAGFAVGDDNTCERIEVKKKPQPTVKRDEPAKPRAETSAPAKPQASGQILCDGGGCRAVQKGCRMVPLNTAGGVVSGGTGMSQREVCN